VIRSIIATIIFLVVTIVASVVSVPAALFDRSGWTYLWITRIWAKSFLLIYGVKQTVLGREHIKKKEHYVFVANHSSYTDVPIAIAAIPKGMRLIFRNTLTRIPIWGWALLVSPYIIINRSNAVKAKKSLAHAAEVIRNGGSILLFPEGTRSPTGELQQFKRGAFHLAYESGAKVIPIAIKGAYEFLPRTARLPLFNKKIAVSIGVPLEVSLHIENARDREIDLMRRSEDAVRKMLVNL